MNSQMNKWTIVLTHPKISCKIFTEFSYFKEMMKHG